MALITCKQLNIGYDGKTVASQINFVVNKGDYLCIVGENGSGKSTLMKTLLGLQKPIDGILTFGNDLRQNKIGYLPQQTAIQKDFPASVWEVILSGMQGKCGWRPFYTAEQKQQAVAIADKFGLLPMINNCYRNLSGGQQQRVLLARALCATRDVILLDEPVTGLDPRATVEMYELINKLNKQDGITVIMISHDLHSCINYATHILHMDKSVFWGSKQQYFDSDLGKKFVGGASCN